MPTSQRLFSLPLQANPRFIVTDINDVAGPLTWTFLRRYGMRVDVAIFFIFPLTIPAGGHFVENLVDDVNGYYGQRRWRC